MMLKRFRFGKYFVFLCFCLILIENPLCLSHQTFSKKHNIFRKPHHFHDIRIIQLTKRIVSEVCRGLWKAWFCERGTFCVIEYPVCTCNSEGLIKKLRKVQHFHDFLYKNTSENTISTKKRKNRKLLFRLQRDHRLLIFADLFRSLMLGIQGKQRFSICLKHEIVLTRALFLTKNIKKIDF